MRTRDGKPMRHKPCRENHTEHLAFSREKTDEFSIRTAMFRMGVMVTLSIALIFVLFSGDL
jgi:hypothetical protein